MVVADGPSHYTRFLLKPPFFYEDFPSSPALRRAPRPTLRAYAALPRRHRLPSPFFSLFRRAGFESGSKTGRTRTGDTLCFTEQARADYRRPSSVTDIDTPQAPRSHDAPTSAGHRRGDGSGPGREHGARRRHGAMTDRTQRHDAEGRAHSRT